MDQKALEKQIKDIAELAKENKNIDAATLMISALQGAEENKLSQKAKRTAYIMSFTLPPLGLFFALYYYFFSDKSDAKHVAIMCVAITAFIIAGTYFFLNSLLSSSGVSYDQLKDAPAQMQQLLQQ